MEEVRQATGLADRATIQLRDFILKQKFQPGDVLPGEVELSLKLGVSRTIIREALSRFRMMGIVESRRRRGMVLRCPDFLKGMELALNGSWMNKKTLREMFELRLMMEMGISDYIFNDNRERLIKKLERILIKEENTKRESMRIRADAEFHEALYEATGNETLLRFQKILYPLFVQYASLRTNNNPPRTIDHRQLFEEVKNGTPDSFRVAMRQHLEPHFTDPTSQKE